MNSQLMPSSSEAGDLASSSPARRRSQRLQGAVEKPADDSEVFPVGDQSVSSKESLIPAIRSASRLLVREFGFMSSTLAGTQLSHSAVHALIEISSSSAITATTLSQTLNLEKSSVSRMLKKLMEAGLVEEQQSAGDKREKSLFLTNKGVETIEGINAYAEKQVGGALARLKGDGDAEVVLKGIASYGEALRETRLGTTLDDVNAEKHQERKAEGEVEIKRGYQPGILARCMEMHMEYYSRAVGFGSFFEAQVGTEIGAVLSRLSPSNPSVEIFAATLNNKVVGTVWMDGSTTSSFDSTLKTAHLRAFIVDEKVQGKGVGRKLITAALAWADGRGFEDVDLWTFKELNVARKLYDGNGFLCVEEMRNERWGTELLVQRLVRKAGGRK